MAYLVSCCSRGLCPRLIAPSICLGQTDARGNRHDVALAQSFAGAALRRRFSKMRRKIIGLKLFGRPAVVSFALLLAGAVTVSGAANSRPLTFTTHAAFFSTETSQSKPLDPQVFVQDASVGAQDHRRFNMSPDSGPLSSIRTPRPRLSTMPKVNHWILTWASGWAPKGQ